MPASKFLHLLSTFAAGLALGASGCGNVLGELETTEASQLMVKGSCGEWQQAGYDMPGIYLVDMDGALTTPIYVQCVLDAYYSQAWMLVLNYLHQGGTNPNLNVMTNRLPLPSGLVYGQNDAVNLNSWGHAAPAMMAQIPYTAIRFYCRTSAHARVINTWMDAIACRSYFNTGTGACSNMAALSVPLPGDSANLPVTTTSYVGNQGNSAMTAQPFYQAGRTWSVKYAGDEFECDDNVSNSNSTTHHQIFVRW